MSAPPPSRATASVRDRLAHACERLTPSDGPRWDLSFDLASAVVGAVVLVLIAMTFTDYGITWDETWHLTYGRHVIHWYVSGFTDDSALNYRADYLYGGSFDALGYVARELSPLDRYATIHLFGALVGCMGLLGAWKFGRLLGGPAAGFLTLSLLVLTPVWYGHMFNNPKDMPFAVGYVWALYYEVRILIAMPAVPRREWAKAAIALGVAMSVRIAGLLTLCYLWMLVGLWVLWHVRQANALRPGEKRAWRRWDWALVRRYLIRFAPKLVATSLGAWALMLVFWPWAQLDPLRRPMIALARMSAFNLHERGMPFGDRRISTLHPPPDYLLRYFSFKLPELVLILVLVALVWFCVRARRLRKRNRAERAGVAEPPLPAVGPDERRRVAIGAFLLFAMLFPPLYAIAKRSPLYDGLRHFLFLVPMFVVIAGVTATKLVRLALARSWLAGAGLQLLLVAHAVRMVLVMHHLHPHQYLWFNQFIGGLPGALTHYDTDYYGNTYKEAFETLRRHLWETERERYLSGPYVVGACMPDFIAEEYLGPNFVLHRSGGPPAELYLGYTRNDCYLKHSDAPELTRVERQDTLLVLIRDLRDPEADAKAAAAAEARAEAREKARAKARSQTRNKSTKPKPKPKPSAGTIERTPTRKTPPGTQPKPPKPAPKSPEPAPEDTP